MIRHIRLSGRQIEKLQDALIDAFPIKSSLEQMLLFKLDKNIHEVAGGGNLETVVFELIRKANSQGWIEDLIRSAREDNPGNLLLKNVCEELLANPSVPQNIYTAQSYNKVDFNSKSVNPLKTAFSKKLAVIVGVIATGTMFLTALLSNQPSQLSDKLVPSSTATIDITTEESSQKSTAARDYNELAIRKYEKQEYNRAIDYYSKAIEFKSDEPSYYYNRGLARNKSKDYKGAIEDFSKAIDLKSDEPSYYSSRGLARNKSKDYQGAIEDYSQAIIFGECGCYFEKRAEIYLKLGDKDKATGDYEDAVHKYDQNEKYEESKKAQNKLDQICQKSKESLRGCEQS